MCGISVILVLYQPYNGVPLLVSFSILLFLTYYYLRSGLLTRHLAQRTFAPVLCHLSTSLLGLTTLRASRAEQKLIQKFDRLQVTDV